MFQWYLFNTLFSDIFNGLFLFFCRSQVNGSQGGWCWRFVHIAHLMIEWRNSRFNSYIVDASILGYNWKMMRPRHQRKTISFVFLCPRLLSVSQVKAICSAKIFDCFEHKYTNPISHFLLLISVRLCSKNQNHSRYFKQEDL